MTTTRNAAAVLLVLPIIMATLVGCGTQPSKGTAPPATPGTSATPRPTASSPASPPATSTSSPPATMRVVSSRVAYQWHWPNDATHPSSVTHATAVPPVPELIRVSVGSHPAAPGQPPFNRMSFTFTTAFPSYRFAFTDKLTSDASGTIIPLRGRGVLKIVFTPAQAHTPGGTRSTIVSQPPANIGYQRMADYRQAGDFEGVLTYGIGVTWPIPQSNPQIPVRAYEVETVTANGQHLYVVAIDIDATSPK